MTHSKAFAILSLAVAVLFVALGLAQKVIAAASEADAQKLRNAILDYVAQRNPYAPIKAYRDFPEVLLEESQRSNLDHCLVLAQADVESEFHQDAVGSAGEIGLFQILPSTAVMMEPIVGEPFRRPVLTKTGRDLGDLANPIVSTRYAMAYLRDILSRRPTIREALTEYNGGPAGRHPHYYRMVMGTYVELLEHPELRCRFREMPKPQPMLTAAFIRA